MTDSQYITRSQLWSKDEPIRVGDQVRITADFKSPAWRKGTIVTILNIHPPFYIVETNGIRPERRMRSVLYRKEFTPLKYEDDGVGTNPHETPMGVAREAERHGD